MRLSPPTRGNPGMRLDFIVVTGLSSPRRGNRLAFLTLSRGSGSIPAHAGEPTGLTPDNQRLRVYPRPRGGTNWINARQSTPQGLSPPTRGTSSRASAFSWSLGLSPPTRGEPSRLFWAVARDAVYPRPRGGTRGCWPRPLRGLSPPTRGNRRPCHRGGRGPGSIPAHAGEPLFQRPGSPGLKVYPRPRRGTWRSSIPPTALAGLSPPTQGNP